jgi:hypothetical protein
MPRRIVWLLKWLTIMENQSKIQARIVELTQEIADVQEQILFLQSTEDPELMEDAPSRIAVLETDLENLLIWRDGALGQLGKKPDNAAWHA